MNLKPFFCLPIHGRGLRFGLEAILVGDMVKAVDAIQVVVR